MIFAGLLLVHEAVVVPGGLDPVTGALVVGEGAPQHEPLGIPRTHPANIIGVTNTKVVKSLCVMLKVILGQEHGECPFGHREDG